MDDLDDLIATPPGPGLKDCRVGWWLAHGDHEDITNGRLAAAVAGHGQHTAVAAAFTNRGMPVGKDGVRNHRKGACKCPR